MEPTDPAKARSALTLFGGIFLAQAALLLLNTVALELMLEVGGLFSALDSYFTAVSALWLVVGAVETYAFFALARTVKPAALAQVVFAAALLLTLSSAYFLLQDLAPQERHERLPVAANVALMVIGLVEAIGASVLVGRLGRTTAFAVATGTLAVVRGLASLALALRPEGADPLPSWVHLVRTALSVACLGGIGALALHARTAVTRAAGLPEPPLTAPILEASGMRQVVIGVVLLVLGIGGSALSYAAASSGSGGGRYFVATGLIAAGLVQLVRGVTRLGR